MRAQYIESFAVLPKHSVQHEHCNIAVIDFPDDGTQVAVNNLSTRRPVYFSWPRGVGPRYLLRIWHKSECFPTSPVKRSFPSTWNALRLSRFLRYLCGIVPVKSLCCKLNDDSLDIIPISVGIDPIKLFRPRLRIDWLELLYTCWERHILPRVSELTTAL